MFLKELEAATYLSALGHSVAHQTQPQCLQPVLPLGAMLCATAVGGHVNVCGRSRCCQKPGGNL